MILILYYLERDQERKKIYVYFIPYNLDKLHTHLMITLYFNFSELKLIRSYGNLSIRAQIF